LSEHRHQTPLRGTKVTPRPAPDNHDYREVNYTYAGREGHIHEVVEIAGRRLADGRALVSVVLSDGNDCLEGVWFNQVYTSSRFRYGQRVAFSGKPKRYQGHWQMTNPRVAPLEEERPIGCGNF